MRLIDYGKITKSHGLKGGLKIVPFSGETAALKTLGRVFVRLAGDDPESFKITEKIVGEKSAFIKLAGVDTRDSAEKFRGLCVMVATSDLPETSEGEYYNFQLAGLSAVSGNGAKIGTVESVLQSGFQSVLVVSTDSDGGELLVPMAEKFIADIDIEEGTVTVKNVEILG